jgi:trimethylamine--corrinoid protein Co-methyltransferase
MVAGSKLTDAQAAYESNMTMQSVLLAGANYVLHAAGWLEAGLTASFSKFVLDCEQMEMFYRLAQGVSFADLEAALEAVREVGPGGHFLGTKHTQDHFETAFYMPELLDNNNFEQWEIDGAEDAATRAIRRVREELERYGEDPPALDPAVDQALKAYIAEREAVLPDNVS